MIFRALAVLLLAATTAQADPIMMSEPCFTAVLPRTFPDSGLRSQPADFLLDGELVSNFCTSVYRCRLCIVELGFYEIAYRTIVTYANVAKGRVSPALPIERVDLAPNGRVIRGGE